MQEKQRASRLLDPKHVAEGLAECCYRGYGPSKCRITAKAQNQGNKVNFREETEEELGAGGSSIDLEDEEERVENSILEVNEVSTSSKLNSVCRSPMDQEIPPINFEVATPEVVSTGARTRSAVKTVLRSGNMLPLVTSNNGQDRYKPFRVGDVQAIIDKMPPISEGGGLWVEQLAKITAGHTLALVDFRAVAARCFTAQDLHEIEVAA